MINRSRIVVNRFLNEDTYKLIKHGYLAVYKRPELTSAEELEDLKDAIINGMEADDAVKEEKYLLRAGHGGNLDSMATGVLAVGLCDGCKILPYLLASNKRYTVTAKMGVATDTYNSIGRVVAESGYEHVTRPMLEEALTEFVGEIWQKPPVYSAVKIKGQRASDIASSGEDLILAARPVICHAARCIEFDPPYFTLDISCGRGFYIRSLVHELAEEVGSCAHVTALVRTKHGPFLLKDCLHSEHYNLENIVSAVIESRRKHPQLKQKLDEYWKNHEEKYLQKQKKYSQREEQLKSEQSNKRPYRSSPLYHRKH